MIVEKEKQYFMFDPGAPARPKRDGISKDRWRDIEGRLERLRSGEIFENKWDDAAFAVPAKGMDFKRLLGILNTGHWKVQSWGGSSTVEPHYSNINEGDLRIAMQHMGYQFGVNSDGGTVVTPPKAEKQ